MKIFTIFLSALLVNNFVLSRFLGICPFLGVSKKVETATGMGAAVTFVMALASIMTFLVEKFILANFDIMYLSTLAFILVIASLVQFVEMVIKKVSPDLYKALGIFLPLITTNCAVLGVAVINSDEGYNLIESLVNSVGAALGFTLALVLLAGIREKLDTNEYIPEALKGLPITLITAGLMAIAFLGFQGLI
ncbi:electron transport complex subunit RsxA [Clostridium cochlearium]|jgi:electron transport complex protein RnfA|uniref:Ion-translocating oxidoreductase complex subunit A n=1 Tax=Clostridium cochlearium TaxID=1494 RepID=A0A239ZRV9_CLOCO|nr:electron transport complex subunit RsxA [Clostridium cochlearium]MBV1818850.1 electron transport complex subunit RsxA [Bacteroidales bacterium MSK.15.36]NSJ91568.1 electron transport complex subunit RsxA [Coprococcus sp. MSK.21.13]MBU5269335.1 electron transport complex subunit RsxA [Clostridium cochlearium]MCG4572754.1 electron transport complex subunit RsxA [Clostridium cochlearium]MCG4578854.1 electron transport complex subunit RsxA [Clostridium cochlearium]